MCHIVHFLSFVLEANKQGLHDFHKKEVIFDFIKDDLFFYP